MLGRFSRASRGLAEPSNRTLSPHLFAQLHLLHRSAGPGAAGTAAPRDGSAPRRASANPGNHRPPIAPEAPERRASGRLRERRSRGFVAARRGGTRASPGPFLAVCGCAWGGQIGRVIDHERTYEANFQGEFNSVPGQKTCLFTNGNKANMSGADD